MKSKIVILFALFLYTFINAQTASEWKNYTNMQNVQALAASDSNLWAATSGGGFLFNAAKSTYKSLHRTDGLNGINLTAIAVDKYGKIWFGSKEGIIDVYNPSDNSVKSILDIYNSNYSVKQILELKASGDTIFASTSYGISLINATTLLFKDTFFKFGSFSSSIQVNSVFQSGLLYASTVQGLAIQKQGTTNLSAPESWNVYTTADGLPDANVKTTILYHGSIIAGTTSGMAVFDGSSWQSFQSQINSNIYDLMIHNDTLFILSDKLISVYYNDSIVKSYTLSSSAVKLAYSASLGLLYADGSGVHEIYNSSAGNTLYPDGPAANYFSSIAVDNNSNVWCASGRDVTGSGFYKYNGSAWTNYNKSTTPSLLSNAFHTVYAAPDNTIYFGNWGNGYVSVKNNTITNYTASSTGMKGIQINPDFLVITGFGVDSKNSLWVLNYGANDIKNLNVYTTDSAWYHYYISSAGSSINYQYFNLAVDQYDTKWFNCLDANRTGLFYYNENGSYSNSSSLNGYLTTSDGLTSNTINSVVVDKRGDVWVGTSIGANIISNTESITSSTGANLVITSIYPLREYTINCLAVDPINQKWIGTNQGLILVNSDGTEVLASYNTSNSALLSNNITSLGIDKNKGIVYVGSDQGLTSFKTSAVEPKDSFTKLFIYPSPFVIKSSSSKVTIDGLIKDCDIKIITIYGKLVKEFSSPGGRVAFWDGTNNSGSLVSSGVYIVVAYDKDGNSVCTGKIAVIRR